MTKFGRPGQPRGARLTMGGENQAPRIHPQHGTDNMPLKLAGKRMIALIAGILLLGTCLPAAGLAAEDGTVRWSEGMEYVVKPGDTLWSISERFFDTPALWPELWKLNPGLKNPHWIYPGQVLSVYAEKGSLVAAPAPGTGPSGFPVLPEPQKTRRMFNYPQAQAAGFVRQTPVDSVGTIFRTEGKKTLISQGDRIYVQATKGAVFAEGDRFTVFRDEGELENPFGGRGQKVLGIQYRILGSAFCEKAEPGILVAIVESSFEGMSLGDLLMPYREVPGEFAVTLGKKELSGHIVASEDRSFVFGQDDVVFIDLGCQQGVAPGYVFNVFHQEPGLEEGTLLPPVNFGQVLVIWTEDNNSTAVVTESDRNMSPGASIQSRLLDLP